jgi:hypothetical protein
MTTSPRTHRAGRTTSIFCCFPTCRLLQPDTSPSTANWYSPLSSSPSFAWDDLEPTEDDGTDSSLPHHVARDGNERREENRRRRRREMDLLSLHEGIGLDSAPTRKIRRGTGDITGGGANEGSGLSRWTLFLSWLRSKRNRIKLPEDEDWIYSAEEEQHRVDHYRNDGYGGMGIAEGDAEPLSLDLIMAPPQLLQSSPPHSIHPSHDSERFERKRARRIKRRAKELGLTVAEFERGVDAGRIASDYHDQPEEGGLHSETTSHSSRSRQYERNDPMPHFTDHFDSTTIPLPDSPSTGHSHHSPTYSRTTEEEDRYAHIGMIPASSLEGKEELSGASIGGDEIQKSSLSEITSPSDFLAAIKGTKRPPSTLLPSPLDRSSTSSSSTPSPSPTKLITRSRPTTPSIFDHLTGFLSNSGEIVRALGRDDDLGEEGNSWRANERDSDDESVD